ncbi:hypothetical protein DOY81_002000 [Sarcophaga bullata]|nr:hypothetical protein DOY81_002000 [Sarcophaga bullata]
MGCMVFVSHFGILYIVELFVFQVPAVQKYTISSVSPKVVTQVGAIRKQLQVERIFSENSDSQR